MSALRDVHLALAGGQRSDLVGLATEAERLGYGGVWVAEGPGRDAFSLLTEIAVRTTALELGTGIVNIYGRTPTALAQAAASLAEAAPGRGVHLGLGTGSRILIEGAYGLAYDRPFTRMREAISIVRQALAGERVSAPGKIFRVERLKLNISGQDRVGIYVAGLSPQMLAITGEHADGWLPIWPSKQAFTTALHAQVTAAAAAAGRRPPGVAAYTYTCLDDEDQAPAGPAAGGAPGPAGERALAALRRALAWYMTSAGPAYANLFRAYGHAEVVDAVQAKWQAGERAAARAAIPAEVVGDLALTGRAETVPAQLDELQRLGIAHPVLRFPDDLSAAETARMLTRIAAAYAHRELVQAR